MKQGLLRRASTTALLACALAFSAAARAEEAPSGDVGDASDGGEDAFQLADEDAEQDEAPPASAIADEVVITATKRAEAIQDVPISVTALSGAFLEETGVTEFGQLQQFVPNLQILPVTDSRSTSIRIRGIGSTGTNAGIDPSVGVFIDGIYQGRAGMSVSDLVDIERIEVLRGPQGTLYGKNTAAGAINIHTRNPGDAFSFFGESVLGNYGAVELRGAVNIPLLEDSLALRVSGFRSEREGYDFNIFDETRVNDANKWGVRSKLLWNVTDELSILINGDFSDDRSRCCVGDIISFDNAEPFPKATQLGAHFDDFAALTGVPLPEADPFDRIVATDTPPRNDVTVGGVSLDVSYALGDYTLRSLTAYRTYGSDSRYDSDFSFYEIGIADTSVDFYQVSSELLVVSPGGERLEYQAGLYFFHSNLHTIDNLGYTALLTQVSGIPPAVNTNDNVHETYSFAGFGQATWNIDETWSVTGGFRLDWERKSRSGSSESTCGIAIPPVCGQFVERNEERNVLSPQGLIVGRYRPTDRIMIYASFSNGFKSGGFNQLRVDGGGSPDQTKSEFDDEKSLNYELGIKSTWLDSQILGNLTLFFTDYDHFQAQISSGSEIRVANAGRLYSWGVESEYSWTPDLDLSGFLMVGGSLGLNFTQYQEFPKAPATATQQVIQTGNPIAFGATCSLTVECSQDLAGQRLDQAPIVSLSLFYAFEHELPSTDALWFTRGDYLYETWKFMDADLDPFLIQDDVHILNLRTGFKSAEGTWEFAVWVDNVIDQQRYVAASDVPVVSGFFGVLAPPRTYGGTIRVNF